VNRLTIINLPKLLEQCAANLNKGLSKIEETKEYDGNAKVNKTCGQESEYGKKKNRDVRARGKIEDRCASKRPSS